MYAILRSIPNKLAGVAAIALVFISLFALPYIQKPEVRSAKFRILHEWFFWIFAADVALLTWIGQKPVEQPYILMGQLATVWFFLYFLVLTPSLAALEAYFVKRVQKNTSLNLSI